MQPVQFQGKQEKVTQYSSSPSHLPGKQKLLVIQWLEQLIISHLPLLLLLSLLWNTLPGPELGCSVAQPSQLHPSQRCSPWGAGITPHRERPSCAERAKHVLTWSAADWASNWQIWPWKLGCSSGKWDERSQAAACGRFGSRSAPLAFPAEIPPRPARSGSPSGITQPATRSPRPGTPGARRAHPAGGGAAPGRARREHRVAAGSAGDKCRWGPGRSSRRAPAVPRPLPPPDRARATAALRGDPLTRGGGTAAVGRGSRAPADTAGPGRPRRS